MACYMDELLKIFLSIFSISRTVACFAACCCNLEVLDSDAKALSVPLHRDVVGALSSFESISDTQIGIESHFWARDCAINSACDLSLCVWAF
jgi:hypothetical protein